MVATLAGGARTMNRDGAAALFGHRCSACGRGEAQGARFPLRYDYDPPRPRAICTDCDSDRRAEQRRAEHRRALVRSCLTRWLRDWGEHQREGGYDRPGISYDRPVVIGGAPESRPPAPTPYLALSAAVAALPPTDEDAIRRVYIYGQSHPRLAAAFDTLLAMGLVEDSDLPPNLDGQA